MVKACVVQRLRLVQVMQEISERALPRFGDADLASDAYDWLLTHFPLHPFPDALCCCQQCLASYLGCPYP